MRCAGSSPGEHPHVVVSREREHFCAVVPDVALDNGTEGTEGTERHLRELQLHFGCKEEVVQSTTTSGGQVFAACSDEEELRVPESATAGEKYPASRTPSTDTLCHPT